MHYTPRETEEDAHTPAAVQTTDKYRPGTRKNERNGAD
jgi:hypothetical protein